MKKKSGGGEGGGANKWKALVQSFNPNATPAETEIEAGDNDGPFVEDNDLNPGIADPDLIKDMLEAAEQASVEGKQEQVNKEIDQPYEQLKTYRDIRPRARTMRRTTPRATVCSRPRGRPRSRIICSSSAGPRTIRTSGWTLPG